MTSTSVLQELLVGGLALTGACFVLLGSLGLVRFPGYLMRLHAATKTPTLGVGAILVASAVHFTWAERVISLLEVLAMVLLFATVPVSALMLIRAVLHLDAALAPAPPERASLPGNSPEADAALGPTPTQREDAS